MRPICQVYPGILTPREGICYCPPAGVWISGRYEMAKARRAATARTTTRKTVRQQTRGRRSASRTSKTRRPTARRSAPSAPAPQAVQAPVVAAVATAPARKPTYHEAVALYERGLQALQ